MNRRELLTSLAAIPFTSYAFGNQKQETTELSLPKTSIFDEKDISLVVKGYVCDSSLDLPIHTAEGDPRTDFHYNNFRMNKQDAAKVEDYISSIEKYVDRSKFKCDGVGVDLYGGWEISNDPNDYVFQMFKKYPKLSENLVVPYDAPDLILTVKTNQNFDPLEAFVRFPFHLPTKKRTHELVVVRGSIYPRNDIPYFIDTQPQDLPASGPQLWNGNICLYATRGNKNV